tara:strand:- start:131 stop:772 length:642 start_codon:yes stop_codon:yes gene_type:complete
MTIGQSSIWLNNIKDVDKDLMACVERVWPVVISRLSPTDHEDKITERLVDILREDKSASALGFIYIQFKLKEKDVVGDYTTKGIIDIVLFLDKKFNNYIAYECKRLNTVSIEGKRTASQAGKYVEQGIVRYVTAQYSENLPYGCMLGYVMDGDQDFAFQQLIKAIKNRQKLIQAKSANINLRKGYYYDFETAHLRKSSGTRIVVRHRLFSLVS